MLVHKAYKFRIYPNEEQKVLIVNDGLVCPAIDGVNCPDSADETVHNKVLRKGELRQ
ncbi:MAG: helix-turn-helix domain-containing protein, partial [Acidaminobacter sp.]|uniref:helix-turn-helix domain-containing protein n=1 Tax=Acidaminobacter sp. TaxID=1872102 RepID=UPI0013811D3D|nr:helix-turn-helix domain-containing protein [Acidaminobacter sp.]